MLKIERIWSRHFARAARRAREENTRLRAELVRLRKENRELREKMARERLEGQR